MHQPASRHRLTPRPNQQCFPALCLPCVLPTVCCLCVLPTRRFPDLDHARELSLSPDPCSELTSQQSKEAVRMAWSKGTTFFEGLEPYDAHTHKDVQAPDDLLCPLYVVKWSQPYC